MSIHLKVNQSDFDPSKDNSIQLQFIPASVEEPTTANVDSFFNNYTTEKDGCEYMVLIADWSVFFK